jgi:hypothetical protein
MKKKKIDHEKEWWIKTIQQMDIPDWHKNALIWLQDDEFRQELESARAEQDFSDLISHGSVPVRGD